MRSKLQDADCFIWYNVNIIKIMRRKISFQLSAGGFILLEVVISLAIIAVFFILFQVAATTAILNRDVKHQDLALRIAQSQIENLRSLGYAALPTSSSFTDAQLSLLPNGQASTTISQYNDKTKQAIVTVSWQESGSKNSHNVSLSTLISEGGL